MGPDGMFDYTPKIKQENNPPKETIKFDDGKPSLGLLPWKALYEVTKVLDFGAKKYGEYNWAKGTRWSRLSNAALRHLTKWIQGEDKDKETGIGHLAHCACCILFLITYEKLDLGKDDRYIIKGSIEENK
jgi:hypothetical protein